MDWYMILFMHKIPTFYTISWVCFIVNIGTSFLDLYCLFHPSIKEFPGKPILGMS
jgi:hypothetical protein